MRNDKMHNRERAFLLSLIFFLFSLVSCSLGGTWKHGMIWHGIQQNRLRKNWKESLPNIVPENFNFLCFCLSGKTQEEPGSFTLIPVPIYHRFLLQY